MPALKFIGFWGDGFPNTYYPHIQFLDASFFNADKGYTEEHMDFILGGELEPYRIWECDLGGHWVMRLPDDSEATDLDLLKETITVLAAAQEHITNLYKRYFNDRYPEQETKDTLLLIGNLIQKINKA